MCKMFEVVTGRKSKGSVEYTLVLQRNIKQVLD